MEKCFSVSLGKVMKGPIPLLDVKHQVIVQAGSPAKAEIAARQHFRDTRSYAQVYPAGPIQKDEEGKKARAVSKRGRCGAWKDFVEGR